MGLSGIGPLTFPPMAGRSNRLFLGFEIALMGLSGIGPL